MIHFVREVIGRDWVPTRTSFTHSAPTDTTILEHLFGANILFDQPRSRFEFDSAMLDFVASDTDPQLLQILREEADQLLDSYLATDSLESQVKLFIMKAIGDRKKYRFRQFSQSTRDVAQYAKTTSGKIRKYIPRLARQCHSRPRKRCPGRDHKPHHSYCPNAGVFSAQRL